MTGHPGEVAASAPGKVLFAGGFLVLDRKHTGLVFGLDARIHVRVRPWSYDANDAEGKMRVEVTSPQFRDAKWLYHLSGAAHGLAGEGRAVEVEQVTSEEGYADSKNVFVQTTLQYVLTYLAKRSRVRPVQITILADENYYSTQADSDATRHATRTSKGAPVFKRFNTTLSAAHKTGLGSSAALVTALVSALLRFGLKQDVSASVVHNLAQAAHCAAQGKVGSGFDIAAAVYGSCLYRRFTPSILTSLPSPASPSFAEKLCECVEDGHRGSEFPLLWDTEVQTGAVEIPKDLLLMMCDVDCGSETPGMVKRVLKWREDKSEEAELLWQAIQNGTDDLCRELGSLSASPGTGGVLRYQGLADIIATVRSLVSDMTEKSQVPIEPAVITELLDFCTDLPGVVGGVAPGAGGYDAVALLLRNDVEVVRDLQDRLEGWRSEKEGAQIGKVRLLKVRQASEGSRAEDPSLYEGW